MTHPLFTRRKTRQTESQEPEYWLSYSDLMAGLLMAFALMLMAALYKEGEQECTIGVYESTADTLEQVLGTRQRMIDSLRARFSAGESVAVDSTTGTVSFVGSLLFPQASATVSPAGRSALTGFAREYFPLLMEDTDFRDQLRRIVVEGHTNDDGTYEVNLGLSHARSLAVMLILLDAAGEYRDELEDLVTANGRSFADLLCLPNGQPCALDEGQGVDKAGSRRIEIRFQMDDRRIVQRVLELGEILINPEVRCEP